VGSVEVSYVTEAVKLKLGFSKQKGGLELPWAFDVKGE
jgi:hypothetical protein